MRKRVKIFKFSYNSINTDIFLRKSFQRYFKIIQHIATYIFLSLMACKHVQNRGWKPDIPRTSCAARRIYIQKRIYGKLSLERCIQLRKVVCTANCTKYFKNISKIVLLLKSLVLLWKRMKSINFINSCIALQRRENIFP